MKIFVVINQDRPAPIFSVANHGFAAARCFAAEPEPRGRL
jgi:hypothetical protein